ncbi:MAG: hypothetical protein KAQ96_00575, partial [Thermoplasmata archaeon]|nr:hypothetical protein [Thermoplasmata archaeon]
MGYPDTDVTITTDGSADNSEAAVKTWVKAMITISNPGKNVVGYQHTFTITLKRDLGDGNGYVAFEGQTVTADLTGVGSITIGPSLTDSSGQTTVTITSSVPGTSTVSATFSGEVVSGYADTDVTITTDDSADNSGPVDKIWYVAKITLSPDTVTNGITESHKITAYVEYTDGSTWTPVPDGTLVTFSLYNNDPNAYFVNDDNEDTTSGGFAYAWINADDPGTVNIGAATSFTVGPVTGTFSASTGTGINGPVVSKTYIVASLYWEKHDQNGDLLGGATFEVTRTKDRSDNTVSEDPITVVDNESPDTDSDDGEFLLKDLKFGTYTIQETVAPSGYYMVGMIVTVEITDLSSPNVVIQTAWVNYPGYSLLAPTGVDEDDVLSGDTEDLSITVNPAGKLAPGGFFYYNYFYADDDTTLKVTLGVDPSNADGPTVDSVKVFYVNPTTGEAESLK